LCILCALLTGSVLHEQNAVRQNGNALLASRRMQSQSNLCKVKATNAKTRTCSLFYLEIH